MAAVQQSDTPLNDALQAELLAARDRGVRDPDEAVAVVLAEYGEEWIALAVAERALYYAKLDAGQIFRFGNHLGGIVSPLLARAARRGRGVSVIPTPTVRAGESNTMLADRQIWIGGEYGHVSRLGLCRVEHLEARAAYYRGRASTELRRANGLGRTAALMRRKRATTVDDLHLDSDALFSLMENLA